MNDDSSRNWRREIRSRMRREAGNGNGNVSIHLILGITIVILGILSLVKNLDIFEVRSVGRYFFAALFMAVGSAMVIENRDQRMWQWGIGWLIVGVWMFAYRAGWIGFDIWDLFWPVVLLGVGGYLVRRSMMDDRPSDSSGPVTIDADNPDAPPRPNPRRDTTIRGIGFLSGSDLKPTTQGMERAELFAMMGGVKLDLYDAQLVNDAATINVAALMGGIEIHVPSEWTVISNVLPLMGAYIDKRRPAAGTTPSTATKKTLTINGFVLMGGVEIKN